MENETFGEYVLILESLNVTPQSSLTAFILLLLIYIFIMVSNIGLVVLISMERSLHQPMYLLFCNMSINDVFGATTIIPHLLRDILIASPNRYIHYIDCVTQAFCVHFHASTSHTVLMIMAFDRYVAICNPLRYAAIMTNKMVLKLTVSAWTVTFVMVGILLGLSIRLSRCRYTISHLFCDNASLFKLSCQSLIINHIYGLGYTVVLLGSSMGSISLTYLRIATVCLTSRNKVLNSRALQTCATHLAVYIILLASGFIIVFLHRFPQLSEHRKVAAVVGHIALPALNAVIYGLQIKQVRQKIITMFHMELVVDFRRKAAPPLPLNLGGTPVTSVESCRFLGITISRDLKWELNITTIMKKARKRMFFLRQLKKFRLPRTMMTQFYTSIIESILTYSIITWFPAATVKDKTRLQRVIRSAERVIGCPLPSLESLYNSRALRRVRKIMADPSHPGHNLSACFPTVDGYAFHGPRKPAIDSVSSPQQHAL
ncbi:olfactory receptor 8I2-like [Polymixia lowei]